MTVPNNLTKGVTIKWRVKFNEYSPTQWDLKYVFVSPSDKKVFNAVADGDQYLVTITMADSNEFDAGRYDFQAFVTDGIERYKVDGGQICVIEDFSTTNGFDARTQLEQTVDAIDAYLLGNATNEQSSRKFNGREIQTHSRTELMAVRSQLKRELKKQQQETNIASGRRPGRKIRTVF